MYRNIGLLWYLLRNYKNFAHFSFSECLYHPISKKFVIPTSRNNFVYINIACLSYPAYPVLSLFQISQFISFIYLRWKTQSHSPKHLNVNANFSLPRHDLLQCVNLVHAWDNAFKDFFFRMYVKGKSRLVHT